MKVRAAAPLESLWFTERTGYRPGGDFVAFVAADAVGAIQGMAGFDNWKPNSCQAHVCLDSKLVGRALLMCAMEFVFGFGGRSLMLATVAAHNSACLQLCERLGFVYTHRIRDGWSDGVDLVGLELRAPNCRWLQRRAA